MFTEVARTPGTRIAGTVSLPAPFPLHHGGVLDRPRAAYAMVGPEDAPTVMVMGGISAGRHVTAVAPGDTSGWWAEFAGPGKAVDTHRFRVLGLDFLGGVGASTGPRSTDRHSVPFPTVSTLDQARAVAAVLDHLDIPRLHAFVGSSYGGMVALVFAATFRHRVDRLVVISAAHVTHPMATALRSAQRKAVRMAVESGRPREGLALARAVAMTTYRTAAEFAARFDSAPRTDEGSHRFPVEDYLDNRGRHFADVFTPGAFLCLSESIDLHRVNPGEVGVPTTLVAVESDTLVPSWQVRQLAARIGGPCRLVELSSDYGHDAFLKEVGPISEVLTGALGAAKDDGGLQ